MTTAQTVFLILALLVVLWVAYKIGKLILRIALGLALLSLVAFIAWHFIRHST